DQSGALGLHLGLSGCLSRAVADAVGRVDLAFAVPRNGHPGIAREGDDRGPITVGRDVQHHHRVGVDAATVVGGAERPQFRGTCAGTAVVAGQQDVHGLAVDVLGAVEAGNPVTVRDAAGQVLVGGPGH